MKVYSLNDRIDLQIDSLNFKISPLSYKQKIEVQNLMLKNPFEGSVLCVKYTVKEVQGLENSDGTPYKLVFENNMLTDSCIDEILNIESGLKLQLACSNFVNGIPNQILHPSTGEEIKGIKVSSRLPLAKKKK